MMLRFLFLFCSEVIKSVWQRLGWSSAEWDLYKLFHEKRCQKVAAKLVLVVVGPEQLLRRLLRSLSQLKPDRFWKDQNGTADFVKLNSAEFVMIIGHLKEFLKLTFRALSLRESEWRSCLWVCCKSLSDVFESLIYFRWRIFNLLSIVD